MGDTARLYEVEIERNVEARMRDGTILRADIYRPKATGKLPVLMCRTPYDKTTPLNADISHAVAARGYIALAQDIRGTHASDGDYVWIFDPAAKERESRDGYDAVEWAARLPGSDGRVGTFGVSYSSFCSWCLASALPPSLKAMHVGGMGSRNQDMNFGIFETGRRLQWTYNQAADQRRRHGRVDGPLSLADASTEWIEHLRFKWVWRLPLETIPEYVLGPLTDSVLKFHRQHADDIYNFDDVHPRFPVPVCSVSGWWDRVGLSVCHYERLTRLGPPDARQGHRLVIGPWSHHPFQMRRGIGPRDYGSEADYPYADQIADWYDYQFKGIPGRIGDGPPVHLFIVNDNTWRQFDHWPPAGVEYVDYFLHSGGKANSAYGDGSLSTIEPEDEQPDHYVYDPSDPFMSVMGLESHYYPRDQRCTDYRTDNLVFQTMPLGESVLVVGPVKCLLWASSDAIDTDFAVKLIEVGEDGLPINISQGIVRARYRSGYDNARFLEPNRPYLFEIVMLPACIRFQRGSRIRFDVASSDFPAFDRNHNTGRDYWSDPDLRAARQTIFHDRDHPSRLVLPVLRD